MIRNLRVTAAVAVLLLAGGTAWAQSFAAPPLPPPFLPMPPGMMPCGMMNGCMQAPAAAPCGTGNITSSTTVAELMKLYRMLYRQGKHVEAGAVARQVMDLNPLVGRTALALACRGCCDECGASRGCCTGCGPGAAGCACGSTCACCGSCCGNAHTAARDCACGAGCKCCTGDKTDCSCGKACACSKPTKTAAGPDGCCHGMLTFAINPCLPGMACPVPFMMSPPCPPALQVTRVLVFGPNPLGAPCAVPPCPFLNALGAPLPPCCCAMTACKPSKPVTTSACCSCCSATAYRTHASSHTAGLKPSKAVKTSAHCGCCAAAAACETRESVHEENTPVCITASGNRVQITTPAVQVECDRVTAMSRDGRVYLEGNVSVEFRCEDRPAALSAEHVSLGLSDGSYEIDCPATSACRTASGKPTAGCGACTNPVKPCCQDTNGTDAYKVELEAPCR